MASITRTWFYPDKKPYVNLPHAHVELYINNQYIETMQWKTLNNPRNPDQPDTLFLSNTIPAEGDRIKIVASTPEYGTVTAEDIIPKKVPIKNASHTIKKVTEFIKEQFPTILKYTMKSRLMNFRKEQLLSGQNHTNKNGLLRLLRNRNRLYRSCIQGTGCHIGRKYGIQRIGKKRRSPLYRPKH